MSSPLSNLKRITKVPLPGYIRKFPLPSYPESDQKETDSLLEEVAIDIASRRSHSQENLPEKLQLPRTSKSSSVVSKAVNTLTSQPPSIETDNHLKEIATDIASRHCHSQENLPEKLQLPRTSKSSSVLPKATNTPSSQPPKEAPSDKELMSLMMGRISALEAKVYSQSKELIQKSRTISLLEENQKIWQQQNNDTSPAEMAKLLKMQCVMLQKQVQEMEVKKSKLFSFAFPYPLGEIGAAQSSYSHSVISKVMERNEEKDQVEDRVLEPRRSKRQGNVVSYTPKKKHKVVDKPIGLNGVADCKKRTTFVDFLYDYGLIWIGEADAVDENVDCGSSRGSKENHIWKPGESTVAPLPKVDYDVVLQKIKELNVLVGDGVAQVEHTKDGARLKYPHPVQLTLYKNGILMFDGPFRPLSDPMTRNCLYDIMEGFFPSEFQARFPDGVPFKVTDKREVYYEDTRHRESFPGVGKTLDKPDEEGDSSVENILQASTSEKSDQTNKVVNERPGPALSVNQFVEKLPLCVIKNGKVIDIRQSIWSLLKNDTTETQVTIVNTEATQEMKERLQSAHRQRQGTPESTATLRVKSENGDHTYVLKMKPQETIGDLRNYLDGQRNPDNSSPYQILSTFPLNVLSDNNATIQDCGLTPSATLHLRFLPPKT